MCSSHCSRQFRLQKSLRRDARRRSRSRVLLPTRSRRDCLSCDSAALIVCCNAGRFLSSRRRNHCSTLTFPNLYSYWWTALWYQRRRALELLMLPRSVLGNVAKSLSKLRHVTTTPPSNYGFLSALSARSAEFVMKSRSRGCSRSIILLVRALDARA